MSGRGARFRLAGSDLAGVVCAVLATVAYAVYSLVRQGRYESKAFDMGVLDQVVWYWSQFRLPANTIQGFPHVLGDHFSPVLMLFAPGYWIVHGPAPALVGQALLVGISVLGVHHVVRSRLDAAQALVVTISYALFWGVWAAIDFDFHETAFAAALLPWAIGAAEKERWRLCAFLLAALLLVKEDMGLVVAAFGLWLVVRGERRPGLVAIGGGAGAYVFINAVLMPLFSGGEPSATDQRIYGHLGSGPMAISWHVVSHPIQTLDLLTQPSEKIDLLLLSFGAFLFLGLLSPITIITLPQFAERLLANEEHYWAPLYHYTLVVAPVLAIGAADGLARLERWLGGRSYARAVAFGLTVGLLMLALGSAVTGPPRHLFEPGYYEGVSGHSARADVLARIPRDAPVAASDYLVPHLSSRSHIYLLNARGIRRADWLAIEADRAPVLPGWRTVADKAGVVVMRRVSG